MFDSLVVVGATGAVGRIVRSLLEERAFPYKRIKFLASQRSAGTTLTFRGKSHTVELLCPEALHSRRPGHQQHAGRRGTRLHPGGGRAGGGGGRRKRLLADGPEGPAGRAGGEPGGDCRAPGNHRQPQLFDHADGRGHEAAARRGPHSPRGGQHLSGDQRRGGGRRAGPGGGESGRAGGKTAYQYGCFAHPIAFNLIPQIGSPKHAGLHVRRNEDGLGDAEDLRRRFDPGLPHLRPRAGDQLPQREHPGRDREADDGRGGPGAVRRHARASR